MPAPDYDVLIIGSGASGGMAAWALTQQGARCLLLDAGPQVDFARQRIQRQAYELPYLGFGKPGRLPHVLQANEYNANQWVDEAQVPYTHDAKSPYNWVRVRMIGGKSNFWARMSFRLSDYEFKPRDHDGFGDNWPVSHAELAPFYSRVEPIFRVAGRKEGWDVLPDGNFVEDTSADSEVNRRFIAAAAERGIRSTKMRRALGRGAFASSMNLLLPEAAATGKLTIVPNAIVRELTVDKATGQVTGAHFVDRQSRRELQARAKVVVLGASCLESTRILLNSGLANSSGALGHYLHDQLYITQSVVGVVPQARGGRVQPGFIGGGGIIPKFHNLKGDAGRKTKNFLRGYSLDWSSGGGVDAQYLPFYGEPLQKALEDHRSAAISATVMGEVLPRFENHVRLNRKVTDAWGIPVLHIDAKYGENEAAMAKDAIATMEELVHACGWEVLAKHDQMFAPGYSIHEVGTCRMGGDPKTSVLNKWNQSHDIKNLFVVDGSSFVNAGPMNPTMTILALSLRASEYLAGQMRAGGL
jgi:choline dehydrogenase-like flavoprotein